MNPLKKPRGAAALALMTLAAQASALGPGLPPGCSMAERTLANATPVTIPSDSTGTVTSSSSSRGACSSSSPSRTRLGPGRACPR